MKITPLQNQDFLTFTKLLSDNNLPIEDLKEDNLANFYVLQNEQNEVLGGIGLEVYTPYGLLRSLVVNQSLRNQNEGKNLVSKILQDAQNQGLKAVYLLTTTAKEYFLKLGFEQVNRENVPSEIQATSEFSSVCPSSATVMVKNI